MVLTPRGSNSNTVTVFLSTGYYATSVIAEHCNISEMLSTVLVLKYDCDPVAVEKHAPVFLAAKHTFSQVV